MDPVDVVEVEAGNSLPFVVNGKQILRDFSTPVMMQMSIGRCGNGLILLCFTVPSLALAVDVDANDGITKLNWVDALGTLSSVTRPRSCLIFLSLNLVINISIQGTSMPKFVIILECGVRNIVEFVLDCGIILRFNVVTGKYF